MTPEERKLIEGVFERLQQARSEPIDQEAETLIQDRMRSTPNAAYSLVRAVILLEQQIQVAENHVKELERQAPGQGEAPGQGGAQRPGGFLSGGSVPRTGGAVWNRGIEPADLQPQSRYEQDRYAQSAPQAQASQGPWSQPQTGSFLGGIASTAAGVAGGMLAANALSHLFGSQRFGGTAHAGAMDPAGTGSGGGLGGADYAQSGAASALGIDDIGRGGGSGAGAGGPSYAGDFGGSGPDAPDDEPDYDDSPDEGYDDAGGDTYDI